MARKIPPMTEVAFYPERKDPQERFDTLIKAAVDGGATLTRELNATFIPAVNGIAEDVESAQAATSAAGEEAKTKAGEAATSAQAAAGSATAARASQDAARTSETSAKASETAAKGSETRAETSETAAKQSETEASASAATATAKADEARTSAGNAAQSEKAAKVSQDAAKVSETAASNRADEASRSADTARVKAGEASASATAAAQSAATAGTSEAAAKASQDKAAESAARAKSAAESAETIAGGDFTPTARRIAAGTGLSGGGDLTEDRSFSVEYGNTAGTACEGNDIRLSEARTPTSHHAEHEPGGSDQVTRFSGNIAETFQNLGTVSGARAIDLSAGNIVLATVGGATTFSFTGLVAGKANTVLLKLTNAGSAAITWPAAVKWAGGAAPVFTAAGLDVVALETDDDGATWIGILSGMDMQ